MTVIRFAKDLQCPAAIGPASPLRLEYIEAEFQEPLNGNAIIVLSCPHCGDWWLLEVDLSHLNIHVTQEMIDTTAQLIGQSSSNEDIPF